ncbi:MAG: GNAT family N-acetyltransferase [Desertimonas sp.]
MRHPSGPRGVAAAPRLFGKRVMLRPLVAADFDAWRHTRTANDAWLRPWEPRRPPLVNDPTHQRDVFATRCAIRDRDASHGSAFGFGLFVRDQLAGEVNLNHVLRGALQTGTIGYWIDQAWAGQSLVAEGVVVLAQFAFEQLDLHRLEICIVPRNHNSRRVMQKLELREEGIALRYLEINGTWEDHVRYGFTVEEWKMRRDELRQRWL